VQFQGNDLVKLLETTTSIRQLSLWLHNFADSEEQRHVAQALGASSTLSALTLCRMSDQGFVELVLEKLAPSQSRLEELLLHCGGTGSTFPAQHVSALVQQLLSLRATS
jgi:hypothetical protein